MPVTSMIRVKGVLCSVQAVRLSSSLYTCCIIILKRRQSQAKSRPKYRARRIRAKVCLYLYLYLDEPEGQDPEIFTPYSQFLSKVPNHLTPMPLRYPIIYLKYRIRPLRKISRIFFFEFLVQRAFFSIAPFHNLLTKNIAESLKST